MKAKRNKVIVAMSGGVDSSVAAALLKYGWFLPAGRQVDVAGVFMKFWRSPELVEGKEGENRCCSDESEKLARRVAQKIGIPFYVVNTEKEFKKKVVDYFLKEYKEGRTPNPCVVCNKEIKFGLLLEKALKLGADYIATGHYAQLKNNKLLEGKDKEKDQSYFLWQLSQDQLSRILFPVGGYTKPEVRKLAKKLKLPSAEASESQEVCFVGSSTKDFLKKYLGDGLWFYTIGQRKGIGLSGGPYYVAGKDLENNKLIISKNPPEAKKIKIKNINWINRPAKFPAQVLVRCRYRAPLQKAVLQKNGVLIFKKSQIAVTPGQSAVFYHGDELLGGGVIE